MGFFSHDGAKSSARCRNHGIIMKIASFLFPQSQYPADDGRTIQETLQEATLAEEIGVDALFLAEHHFDGNSAYVDPPTFAAALSAMTTRIKIGFAVLQTSLYHPLRLTEQLSLLDHISQGRLIVGLGRGSMVNLYEYVAYEIDPDEAQERFEEIEKIMLDCWTQERVVHNGKYWNFDIPYLRPRPFTNPHPQILRAVTSEVSIKAQGRRGRPVILPPGPNEATARQIGWFKAGMADAGFKAEAIEEALRQSWVMRQTVFADTDEIAMTEGLGYYRSMQAFRSAQSPGYRDMVMGDSAAALPRGLVVGAPDSVREHFVELAKLGIGGVALRLRVGPMPVAFSMNALRLFMNEIAPALPNNA
jgi:alkanesulfonate monooxygenase SsuD/methylene tetrahydromethanopterin reductase-like flavin-dependent oxidoreductase (luciferase family)